MIFKKGVCFGLAMAGGSRICLRIFILRSVAVPVTYILDLNFCIIVIVIFHIPLCGCACDIYLGPQFYHCHLIGCGIM